MRVEKARGTRGPAELSRLLERESARGPLPRWQPTIAKGCRVGGRFGLTPPAGKRGSPTRQEHARSLNTGLGPGILVQTPGESGGVASIVLATDDTNNGVSLLRLLGLYIGLFGLALLTFAYIALTRLIVRPSTHFGSGTSSRRRRSGAGSPRDRPRRNVGPCQQCPEMTASCAQTSSACAIKSTSSSAARKNFATRKIVCALGAPRFGRPSLGGPRARNRKPHRRALGARGSSARRGTEPRRAARFLGAHSQRDRTHPPRAARLARLRAPRASAQIRRARRTRLGR